jgi:hypothetical protein
VFHMLLKNKNIEYFKNGDERGAIVPSISVDDPAKTPTKRAEHMNEKSHKKALTVSILLFSGTANILRLMDTIPGWLKSFASQSNFLVNIIIRSNNPQLELAEVRSIVQKHKGDLIETNLGIQLVEGSHNLGFGAGHNANFQLRDSDFFMILNDDIGFPNLDWLAHAFERFDDDPTLALIADEETPRYINPYFGNGMYASLSRDLPLHYAEASVLIARSSAFAQVGMFDEAIEWAMSEDSDLSFKIQQIGLKIDWMSFPHQHWRSSSVNALPSFAKSSILEHNRARLFAKWGEALRSGKVGKCDVFDIFSDGIGDVFCALFHLCAEIDRLTPDLARSVVVNTSHPSLAALILPDGIKIESSLNAALVTEKYRQQGINNIRSTRSIPFGLPINIHTLLSGALATPIASDDSVRATLGRLRKRIKSRFQGREQLRGCSYCVVHLEFSREEQDGREPSKTLCAKILEATASRFDAVVVIGLERRLTFKSLEEKANRFIDLQSELSMEEVIEVVSSAAYFIGIDSFPAHIAQMAGVRSAIFFGSVNPLSRVWSERNSWPIVADLNCLGCYHDHIEPSVPICMRRDTLCERAVSDQTIISMIDEMRADKPYDWSRLRALFLAKQAKMVMFLNYHPSPSKHLLKPLLPNENVSNLIYEMTDRIISIYGEQNRNAVVDQLKIDNAALQQRLQKAEEALADAGISIGPNADDKLPDMLDRPLVDFWSLEAEEVSCIITKNDAASHIRCLSGDPRILLHPIKLEGGEVSLLFNAWSNKLTDLKIYWSRTKGGFCEESSARFRIGPQPSRYRWNHVGKRNEVLYLRLDPAELVCEVQLDLQMFANIKADDSALRHFRRWFKAIPAT